MNVKEGQAKNFTLKQIHFKTAKTRVQIHYFSVYISKAKSLRFTLTFLTQISSLRVIH